MNFEMEFSEARSALTLSGELTLVNAGVLKHAIADHLNKTGKLHVDFQDVSHVDLSFLQLLCAVHRSALQMNKVFTVNMETGETLMEMIFRAGFFRCQGCTKSGTVKCLWSRGDS